MSEKSITKKKWWSSSSSTSLATTSSTTPILNTKGTRAESNHAKELEGEDKKKKKSLYQRYHDAKTGRNTTISDENLFKYTGKTRSQIVEWGDRTPGVAGNQLAGGVAIGPTTGLGGLAAGEGYGGWGRDGDNGGHNRGLKFPGATVAEMNGSRGQGPATLASDGTAKGDLSCENTAGRDEDLESDGEDNKKK